MDEPIYDPATAEVTVETQGDLSKIEDSSIVVSVVENVNQIVENQYTLKDCDYQINACDEAVEAIDTTILLKTAERSQKEDERQKWVDLRIKIQGVIDDAKGK